ncbi:MAG: carbohydrate porin [Nitrospirae bacterium]|nr:carbohydrate porin [Nitrospirota bacterium]
MKSIFTITLIGQRFTFYFVVVMAVCLSAAPADSQPVDANDNLTAELSTDNTTWQDQLPLWFPRLLGLQFNGIYQNVPGLRSPYAGQNSFNTDGVFGHDLTHIYGIYLGGQLAPALQFYFDYEMAKGEGVSGGHGLGGYTNGDVIRVGAADIGSGPYVARAYFRYIVPLGDETEKVERAPDQLAGSEYINRLEIKLGKMSPSDDFDLNRYANNTRTQFLNYAFMYNPAWDEATDTRGYSYGVMAAIVQPKWRLALGFYMMPAYANGARMDTQVFQAQGSNLEFSFKPNDYGTVIRVLTYLNRARMGNYNEAAAVGRNTASTPDVFADEKRQRTKYGFGVNLEQPLADDGQTGLFGRLGWNDGHNENFCYAEVDQHLSVGTELSGTHWGRAEDRAGMAYAVQGISKEHRDYLAAGGLGMLLGDGALNYGPEQILELYYRVQIGKFVQITPDYQFIANPGYNRDRGPASVIAMRLRVSY